MGRRGIVREFGVGIAVPAILTVLATVAVVFLALGRMSDDVDRIDAGYVGRTATAALGTFQAELGKSAADLSATRSFASAFDLAQLLHRDGAAAPPLDFARLLSADGSVIASAGYDWADMPDSAELRRLVEIAADDRGPALGFLAIPGGAAVAAVVGQHGPGSGRFLLVGKELTGDLVARFGTTVAVDGLALDAPIHPPGRAVRLLAPSGRAVADLVWTPRSPGGEAYARVRMPTIIILTMLALVMVFLLATIWKTLSELRAEERRAREAATHDTLSGLFNRRAFHAELQAAVAGRGFSEVAVLFADLDGFKDVNDTHGHEVGDRLIRTVAAGFRSLVPSDAILARLGGDEFAVLLAGERAQQRLYETGAMMIDFLAAPFDFEGRQVRVGTSVGIATADSGRVTPVELVRRADVAMYEAKSRGKNRVEIHLPEFDFERTAKAEIARDLGRAIAAGSAEIDVYYQPIVSAATGSLVAVEALARWIRPGLGPVSPTVFLPIAEETGLVHALGEFVLRRACRDAGAWAGLRVAVNLSAAQFRHPEMPDLLSRVLREEGFPADRLEVDVTERCLTANPERAQRTLAALRDLGVAIALDDFGTGFSSVAYLRRFPLNRLKIDRSMVLDIVEDAASQRLVESTVALAEALGVHVTAEGIEGEREANALRRTGCHELQGYHLGRPASAEEIDRRVAEVRTRTVETTDDQRLSA